MVAQDVPVALLEHKRKWASMVRRRSRNHEIDDLWRSLEKTKRTKGFEYSACLTDAGFGQELSAVLLADRRLLVRVRVRRQLESDNKRPRSLAQKLNDSPFGARATRSVRRSTTSPLDWARNSRPSPSVWKAASDIDGQDVCGVRQFAADEKRVVAQWPLIPTHRRARPATASRVCIVRTSLEACASDISLDTAAIRDD